MTYDEVVLAINMLEDRPVTVVVGRVAGETPTIERVVTGTLRVPADPYALLGPEVREAAERAGPQCFLIDPDGGEPFCGLLAPDRFVMANVDSDGTLYAGFEDLPESGLPPAFFQINPQDQED